MTATARWALRFWLISIATSIALIVLLGVTLGYSWLELDPNAALALALGVVFSVAIGAGLMALIFYSARSGQDGGRPASGLPRRPAQNR